MRIWTLRKMFITNFSKITVTCVTIFGFLFLCLIYYTLGIHRQANGQNYRAKDCTLFPLNSSNFEFLNYERGKCEL